MIRHWECTELLDGKDFKLFTDMGKTFSPKSYELPPNTAVFVTDGNRRVEGIYDAQTKCIRPLKNKTAPNRDLRLYLDAIMTPEITMIAIDGLAGTGKTSTIVEALCKEHLTGVKANGNPSFRKEDIQHRIVIAKPHVNAAGEEYGHLPGDIDEKFDPTIKNFTQYFNRFHVSGFNNLRDAGYVEILPLGFVRGMDADNMTIVADECQNTTELVTLATRKANKSRIIFLGDSSPFQIDLRGNSAKKNGLVDIIDLLAGAPYFQYINMKTLEHIVRSDEVRDIIKRLFKRYGQDPQEWTV